MSINLNVTPENLEILTPGDRFPCTIGPLLRRSKWKGGTWVRYVEDVNSTDSFTVERSDGIHTCGFLIYGSEDYDNARISTYRNYTSYQNTSPIANDLGTATLTLVAGGGRFLFKQFETQALDAQGQRNGGAIVYNLNDELKVSENGLLCNDEDARLLLATGGAKTLIIGTCCLIPTEANGQKLGLDYKF